MNPTPEDIAAIRTRDAQEQPYKQAQADRRMLLKALDGALSRECSRTCGDTECTIYSACKQHGGSTLRPPHTVMPSEKPCP